MKKKKMIVLIALVIVACAGIAIHLLDFSHEHSYGEWETLTQASCESAQIEVRRCECGVEETREGEAATGHSVISISAESLMEAPMASMVVTADDLRVTGTCGCGATLVITEGIELEGAALVLGENTITVKCDALSTTVSIQAEKLDLILDGVVRDDTVVFSGGKDGEYSGKKELGTKSDMYRVYYRVDIHDILETGLFATNMDTAKVRLVLNVTGGSVTDETTFTLKAYKPETEEAEAAFSDLTWNSVDNKEGTAGAYAKLHWSNGATIVSEGVGHYICADNGQIVITLAYSQLAEFVDENGSILFAFATNTEGLKIGSLESKDESGKPVFQVILNDEHFHVFDQQAAEGQYLVSKSCTKRAKYLMSCVCGEAGTQVFEYGAVIAHTYGPLVGKTERTCTADGMKAHYRCLVCGKYFLAKNGEKIVTGVNSLKISAGHEYKLIQAKDATCTKGGNCKYYKCAVCGKYFDAQKEETTSEAQKTPALGHTYGELVPARESTCTEEGMKAHYRCTVCQKYFVEKNGEMVAVSEDSLKIPVKHDYKLIQAKAATCTKEGNNKYYKCADCGTYFDAQKKETTKEAQKTPALGHDMVTKWDDICHWTECANGCGKATEQEAHSGGTVTETARAECAVCGQLYGEWTPGADSDESN